MFILYVALQVLQCWVDYYVDKFGEEEFYIGKGYFFSCYFCVIYVVMIFYLDENIGKFVVYLKVIGQYDNILIVFIFDNGLIFVGGVDLVFFDSVVFFEGMKGRGKVYLYEGGIWVFMIVIWLGYILVGIFIVYFFVYYDFLGMVVDLLGFEVEGGIDGISLLFILL